MAEEYIMTQEGYDKIAAEYDELVLIKKKEIAESLKDAISQGDLSENADYDAAKNAQAELEERISKLENMMKYAKVVELSDNNDFVGVGSKVKIKDLDSGETYEYLIVGSTEADPFAGKISNESLVGQALLGKKNKEKIEVEVPNGTAHYQIMKISK